MGYFKSVATWAMSSSELSRTTGSECLRSARARRSRPVSRASPRRSRENHWRILLRARGDLTMESQSLDGPASGAFDVRISTVSPVWSW